MPQSLIEQAQDQVRQMAGRLTGDLFLLAGVASLLPHSPQEASVEDLDGDLDPVAALRVAVLCVMIDHLQPAIEDLLTAADAPAATSPSSADILQRLRGALGSAKAAGDPEGGEDEE